VDYSETTETGACEQLCILMRRGSCSVQDVDSGTFSDADFERGWRGRLEGQIRASFCGKEVAVGYIAGTWNEDVRKIPLTYNSFCFPEEGTTTDCSQVAGFRSKISLCFGPRIRRF